VISGSVNLGRAPRIEGWRMEMTPVDFVAEAVANLAEEPDAAGQTFHLANPDPTPAETVFGWLEELGYQVEHLPYNEWLEAVRSAPRRGTGEDAPLDLLRGAAPATEVEIDDRNAYDDANLRRALAETGLRRPKLDAELFANYARHYAEHGWIPASEHATLPSAAPRRG
jgi:thioester reductase-like protein